MTTTWPLAGVVVDPQGAAVPGAQVEFTSGTYRITTQTDSAGQFQLNILDYRARNASGDFVPSGIVSVQRRGFVPLRRDWSGDPLTGDPLKDGSAKLRLVVQPEPWGPDTIVQHVVVTATRIDTQLEDVPADSVALSDTHLAATPALGLDDVLREVPGFTLFRRNSSRTANPGTQGVSMRGLGASGASRALVLVDDVPLNDPFGGWVYWDRVPRESVSSVELVRGGGGASLYGSTAMGGVIQFRTHEPEAPSVSVEGSWGNENTPELSLWTGTKIGPWTTALSTDLFRTDGYVLVPVSLRGPVDSPASSRHALTTLDLGRQFGDSNRIFVRGSFFDEGRHNGTVIQTNGTRLSDFSTGWNHEDKRIGTLSTRLFGLYESYAQTFSSVQTVTIPRDTEFLTDSQKVPSQMIGGNAQWSRPVGHIQTLVAGFEMRGVSGSSNEDLFKLGVPNGRTLSGGQERTVRIFGEDILQLTPHLTANLSLGYDHWSDLNARLIAIKSGVTTITPYPDRTSDAVNPRASLLYHLGHGTSLTASGYRAFRAPTLNELYRSFRQGNTFTENNPALVAERLTGVEAGVRQNLLSNRLNLRGTFFWNDMTDAVVNVTLTTTPTLITRQKQNVSRLLSTGINLDGEFRLSNSLQLSGGYQYTHAVVAAYTPPPNQQQLNPNLAGNWIPQVPHQQFTLQTRYSNHKFLTATVQGIFVGQAFDDDQNSFLLDRYFTVNLYLAHTFAKGFEGFVAAENLINTRYPSAATPVTTLGPPLQARIGFRYQFPSR